VKEPYKKIIAHYEQCLKTHGDTHLGVDWPNVKDALTRYQVMLEVIKEHSEPTSILDFGCGTSHLYQYMQDVGLKTISYSGLDLSTAYIELSRQKYPDNTYYTMDILKDSQDLPSFDYILCNGVFTEKRELAFETMWVYFKAMLPILYSKANKGVAFNVMSAAVDWERWDLFHLPTDLLIDFMTKL
jgi:SAM-dependent methyltransferase